MRHVSSIRQQIGPMGAIPMILQFRIPYEYLFGSRRVTSVFEISATPIPEQSLLVCVEEGRRKGIISVTFDKVSGRRLLQRIRQLI